MRLEIVNADLTRRAFVLALAFPVARRAAVAEDAYKNQPFDDRPCVRRTALGACAEQGAAPPGEEQQAAAPAPPARVVMPQEEAESELVRTLRKRTAENAAANAREVQLRTLTNGMGAQFGPFSSDAPILKPNGDFDVVSVSTLEALKGRGVIVKRRGLDAYADGFDPATTDELLRLGASEGSRLPVPALPSLPKLF